MPRRLYPPTSPREAMVLQALYDEEAPTQRIKRSARPTDEEAPPTVRCPDGEAGLIVEWCALEDAPTTRRTG